MGGLFGGKTQSTTEQRYNAIQLSQSAYGAPVPWCCGTVRGAGFLFWYAHFVATPHTQSSGGKGGGGGGGNTSYTYTADLMMGLCEGPIAGIGNIWASKSQNTLTSLGLTLFTGAGGQATWSYLATNYPSQAVPYDHISYVAAASFSLGNSAGMPNLAYEIQGPLRYSVGGGIIDAEPSAAITDYLTDPNHGANFNYLGTLTGANSFQQWCVANGFFISYIENTQRAASNLLKEVMQITNSDAKVDGSGLLTFVPRADAAVSGNGASYTPNLSPLFSFTDDDYCPRDGEDPVTLTRTPFTQTFNVVNVEIEDRNNQYNRATVPAYDDNDVALNGPRVGQTISLPAIKTLTLGRQVAQQILQRQLYYRIQYQFRVRADYSVLEPMDLVSVTDTVSGTGANNDLCRVLKVTDSENDEIELLVELVPIGPASAPLYNWQASQGWAANHAVAPGSVTNPVVFMAPPTLVSSQGTSELWIAVPGLNNGLWGGCNVWVSFDNVNYEMVDTIYGGARCGTLTSSLASGSDPDNTNTLAVVLSNAGLALSTATNSDADALRTMLWVDGEVVAYGTATLTSTAHYNLTYLRRGKYGSTISSHANGANWVRLDQSILKLQVDGGLYGQTVYFKFQSFNIFLGGLEGLAGLSAFTYTLPVGTSGYNATNLLFLPRVNCVLDGNRIYKGKGDAAFTGSISGSVLTVTAVQYGTLALQQVIVVGGGSYQILSLGTGTGGTGTYNLSASGTVASQPMTSGDWTSDCYSNEGFTSCSVTWRPAQTTLALMFGLSTSPAASSSYTNLNFAIYSTEGGSLQAWESGSQTAVFGAYVAGDTLSIQYDGFWARYYQNGTVLRQVYAPGLTLYADSSFRDYQALATDVKFGPMTTATPVQWKTVGVCTVNDTNAYKQGGSNGWGSDAIYSLVGYGVCHITAKVNVASGTQDWMIGLSTTPTASANYTNANYGWNNSSGSGNQWAIFESGVSTGSLYGAVSTSDVVAITYDGATVTYFLNGVVKRTVSVSGLILYGFCAAYPPNSGLNSLRFGPTANLAVQDTSQIGNNAATDLASTSVGSVTITNLEHSPDGQGFNTLIASVTYTAPYACNVRVTASGNVQYTVGSPAGVFADFRYSIQQDSAYNNPQEWFLGSPSAGGNYANNVTTSRTFSMPAGQTSTFKFMGSKWQSADTVVVNNIELVAEIIKR
jgi:hypothetical protein